MWGGSGAACKARGPEDTASRLLPPWVVTSVTWSGLLRSLPITPSASSPGAAHRGRGPAWATRGAARPAATPAPAQGCGKVAPYCSLMVCFVLWLRAHSQPARPCSGHMALIKTAGHPWSRTAPRRPGGAQECRPTLFSVMSVPQQSANPNQLDTGHCPGGSPGSRTPMGAAVFGAQTGTEGGGRLEGGHPARLRVAIPRASWSCRRSVAGGHACPRHPWRGTGPVASNTGRLGVGGGSAQTSELGGSP